MAQVRNAAAEATARLEGAGRARVLEPSPPAVTDETFADDPVNTVPPGEGPIVSPVPNADRLWSNVVVERPELSSWAADRWLGAYRRLGPPPADYAATRLSLHRVAAYVMSPARRRANGRIALRWTLGGFGTPFFAEDVQVRLEGADLVVQEGDGVREAPLTNLVDAAALVGSVPDEEWASRYDIPESGGVESPLEVDAEAARYLGDWYGFAYSVLEELRSDVASVDDSRVQLWPEHFDAAFEMLSDEEHRRASYGASPGDSTIDEPYVYVAPWYPDDRPESRVWNAPFGAALPLSEFVDAPDQRAAVLEFWRQGRDVLAGGS